MTTKTGVVALVTGDDQQAANVIARLQEALDLARRVPQVGVCIVMISRDEEVIDSACYRSTVEHVGMLEIAKFSAMTAALEGGE